MTHTSEANGNHAPDLNTFKPPAAIVLDELETAYFEYERKPALYKGPGQEHPYDDLRRYVSKAVLPPLPYILSEVVAPEERPFVLPYGAPAPTKTGTVANTITTTVTTKSRPKGASRVSVPNNIRYLSSIERLPEHEFRKIVTQFADQHLSYSQKSLRQGDFVRKEDFKKAQVRLLRAPKIPSWGFDVAELDLGRPTTEAEVASWINILACHSISHLLHVCDTKTHGWEYVPVHGEGTQSKLADTAWTNNGKRRLVMEIKAPWVMGPTDMEKFVNLKQLPTFDQIARDRTRASARYSKGMSMNHKDQPSQSDMYMFSEENVMAQCHDYCVNNRCYFFVLTTYDYWVFGVFDTTYSHARITDALPFDSSGPTILEALACWTQSSMFVPGLVEPMRLELSSGSSMLPPVYEMAVEAWRRKGLEALRPTDSKPFPRTDLKLELEFWRTLAGIQPPNTAFLRKIKHQGAPIPTRVYPYDKKNLQDLVTTTLDAMLKRPSTFVELLVWLIFTFKPLKLDVAALEFGYVDTMQHVGWSQLADDIAFHRREARARSPAGLQGDVGLPQTLQDELDARTSEDARWADIATEAGPHIALHLSRFLSESGLDLLSGYIQGTLVFKGIARGGKERENPAFSHIRDRITFFADDITSVSGEIKPPTVAVSMASAAELERIPLIPLGRANTPKTRGARFPPDGADNSSDSGSPTRGRRASLAIPGSSSSAHSRPVSPSGLSNFATSSTRTSSRTRQPVLSGGQFKVPTAPQSPGRHLRTTSKTPQVTEKRPSTPPARGEPKRLRKG